MVEDITLLFNSTQYISCSIFWIHWSFNESQLPVIYHS